MTMTSAENEDEGARDPPLRCHREAGSQAMCSPEAALASGLSTWKIRSRGRVSRGALRTHGVAGVVPSCDRWTHRLFIGSGRPIAFGVRG